MTQTKLAARAADLKRRIYAALPFGYRVAQLLIRLKLADDIIKRNLGRAFYAEFIRAGVTEMPDVKGQPALDLKDKIEKLKDRGANILPMGYGGAFGSRMWSVASKYLHSSDPAAIADVLQNVVVEVYAKKGKGSDLKEVSLPSAESYIKWLVGKRAQDWLKRPEHKRQFSLTDPETGGMPDLVDTKSLQGFIKMLSPGDANKFKREVDQIDNKNPDRPWSFIEGVLQGRSNAEIARDWGVDRAQVTHLLDKWLPELQRIFRKYVEEQDYALAM